MRLGLACALVVLVLDQLTKFWAIEALRPEGVDHTPFWSPIRFEVTPFFNIVMTWNRGISFGIFNNGGDHNALILSLLSLAIVIGLLFWLRKAEGRLVPLALGLVIGGALGNVIDRARFGAVADFLDFHAFGYHWPAFNIADAGIVVGAGLLLVDALFAPQDSPKNSS
ncbi:signal peptidase II [Telmatospirillum sp. J64-1]|uniref:signal peptidase II n=1 Tax=Telmatospirillum sp. J64-1 TaxID=2502183 RepID=UPI0021073B5D|nr:signal peptidase II [Telmatospirillum sp. J64-1]